MAEETRRTKLRADTFVKNLYTSLRPSKGEPKEAKYKASLPPHIPINTAIDPDPGWGHDASRVLGLPYDPRPLPTYALPAIKLDSASSLGSSTKSESVTGTDPSARSNPSDSRFPQPVPGGPPLKEPLLPPQSSILAASSSSGSSSSSSGLGRVSGPVIDPNTRALQKRPLREFAEGLADALPPLPKDAPRSSVRLHAKLLAEIRAIQQTAADDKRLGADQLGLAVRDHFARASALARKLSGDLGPTFHVKPVSRERWNAALSYLIVSGLLFELKRVHLSAAAKDVSDAYIDKDVRRLDRSVKGLLASAPWAAVSTRKSGGVDVNHHGGQGGLGVHRDRFIMNDDPSGGAPTYEVDPVTGERREVGAGDVDFWESLGVAAQGGFKWSIKGWGLSLLGKADVSRGQAFFEQSNLRPLKSLIVNLDNNRSPARSAGPKARKIQAKLQSLKAKAHTALGRHVVETPGRPAYLHDKKVAKGFTALKLDMACSMLDAHTGGRRFGDLVDAAYPAFGQILRDRLAGGEEMPLRRMGHVEDSAAYKNPDARWGYENEAISANFQAGKGTSNAASAIWNASGKLEGHLTGERMRFNEATKAPAHRIFRLDYFKDFAPMLGLVSDVDALGDHPRLHLFRRVQRALGGEPPKHFSLSPEQEHLYGPASSVPRSVRGSIATPGTAGLREVVKEIRDLSQRYTHFVDDANYLLSRPDRNMSKAERQAHERLRGEAFQRVRESVWGGGGPDMKRALKHPERFVSKSYDALSLALGAAGVHLSLLKHELARHPHRRTDQHDQLIRAVDGRYKAASELFDGMYLPIKAADTTHESLIGATGVWERWRAKVEADASGGADSSVLNAILGHFHKSTGVVNVSNSAGQGKVSAEFQFQYANRQINPVRLGHFIQMTFSAEGGTLTGPIIQRGVIKVLKQFNQGLAPQDQVSAREVMSQLQGLVLPQTVGASLMLKLHKTPGVPGMDLQVDRVLETKNNGLQLSATIPVPHHGGVTLVKPSIGNTDSTVGVLGERIGPDLEYQILRHPQLAGLMDRAGGSADKLRRLFDEFPRLKMAYFGRGDTLLATLRRADDFQKAKAAGRLDPDRPMNAIDRLHNTGAFKRAAEVAHHAQHFAPGSTADGRDPFEKAPQRLSDGLDTVHISGLDAAQARLSKMRTADERADFFCGPEGYPLLQAYRQVMDNVSGIKSAVFFHTDAERPYGFAAAIRDPKLRASLEKGRKLRAGTADARRKVLYGERPRQVWFPSLSRSERGARAMSLADLRIHARNPLLDDRARAVVRKELVHRARKGGTTVDDLMDGARWQPDRSARVSTKAAPPKHASPQSDTHRPAHRKPATSKPGLSGIPPFEVSSKTSRGFSIFSKPHFDPDGAGRVAEVLRRDLSLWGGEDRSDAGSVQGLVVDSAPANLPAERRRDHGVAAARTHMTEESMPPTRAYLAERNILAVSNSAGNGTDCLIIALLQHALRDYGSEHAARVAECRAYLKSIHPQVGNQMLYPDDQAFVDLVAYINHRSNRQMQVLIATPGPDGQPVMLPTIPTGSPDDRVVLLQGSAHYEALTTRART